VDNESNEIVSVCRDSENMIEVDDRKKDFINNFEIKE